MLINSLFLWHEENIVQKRRNYFAHESKFVGIELHDEVY